MNDIAQFLIHYGLPFLFMVVFVEQLGLPIPALPWLLIAGALSASGQFNLPLGIPVTILACLFSDAIWFGLDRRRGIQVIRFLSRFSLGLKSCVRRADEDLSKRRLVGVLLSKFIPGIAASRRPWRACPGLTRRDFFSWMQSVPSCTRLAG